LPSRPSDPYAQETVIKRGLRLGLKKKKKKKKKKPVCLQQQPGWFNCETIQILDAQNLSLRSRACRVPLSFVQKNGNYPEGWGGGDGFLSSVLPT
jgi:hypothetical protein